MSNVSREKSFNFGCVIRFTLQCNSSRLSETSGQVESEITIALLHRNTAISSSGFGSAPTKITTISSGSCGSRWLFRQVAILAAGCPISLLRRLQSESIELVGSRSRSLLPSQLYLLSRKSLSSIPDFLISFLRGLRVLRGERFFNAPDISLRSLWFPNVERRRAGGRRHECCRRAVRASRAGSWTT